ncbi:MAG: ACP phosphodiesterase [Verrucomicrobiota bacterium]
MNWLAHLHLSEPDPASRIGNLLPDILSFPEVRSVSEIFQRGISHHRAIDAFTDRHPVFRQSKRRIDGVLGRYGAILVDVFYDHFLARAWDDYSLVGLEAFVADFHSSIDHFRDQLPERAYVRLCHIRDEGRLLSYREIDGVAAALEVISGRLRRPVELGAGVAFLRDHYDLFADDFRRFYPQLSAQVPYPDQTLTSDD